MFKVLLDIAQTVIKIVLYVLEGIMLLGNYLQININSTKCNTGNYLYITSCE